MRVLALDVGDVRIGVAISDPLGMIASPLEVIDRRKVKAIKRIVELAKEKKVEKIVSGLPLSLNGTEKRQAEKVREFIEKLGKSLHDIPIETVDERYSTVSADNMLKVTTKKNAKEKRKVVDKVAATIILQTYLDMEKRRR
ncbi:Holliday junction resolvase RuvX [Haliovirga abyssi]|uniref:Putative pre-16S rRNA nuclease n=1 Tax=Haliovirga abyssi TaxID=2996794 RepID=A0AAU9DBE2_9FUSO|nr:Holliday junction resolvase RuvX [Haliovirga abyssi]BDU50781.1 putative pre-16S rRNA nuclease [Haliovirga abyssi]